MAEISSPRKGTELSPRVFGTWQEQVNRALRALAVEFRGTIQLNFPSVGGHSQQELGIGLEGAKVGADMLVTAVNGAPPGLAFDGFVAAENVVTIRCINYTGGAINPASATYQVMVWNP